MRGEHGLADSTPHWTVRVPWKARLQRGTPVNTGALWTHTLFPRVYQLMTEQSRGQLLRGTKACFVAGWRAGTRKTTTPIPTSQLNASVFPFTIKTTLCYVTQGNGMLDNSLEPQKPHSGIQMPGRGSDAPKPEEPSGDQSSSGTQGTWTEQILR